MKNSFSGLTSFPQSVIANMKQAIFGSQTAFHMSDGNFMIAAWVGSVGAGIGNTDPTDPANELVEHAVIFPFPGTIKNFYVIQDAAPGGGDTNTYTFIKNTAPQPVTVTIAAAATTGNDTTNSFAVAAGDLVALKFNGTVAGAGASWAYEFDPS